MKIPNFLQAHICQNMEAMIAEQFKEPRIHQTVSEVAATKAQDLLIKQIQPEVDAFKVEIAKDGDYIAAMHRSHGSIGFAMYYTTMAIIVGFSVLMLSNFIPTIYFGLLTVLAMLMALAADLLLLPRLILWIRPFNLPASS